MKNLSLEMKELTLGPGEILFHKNDQDSRLFFVHRGEIELFLYRG